MKRPARLLVILLLGLAACAAERNIPLPALTASEDATMGRRCAAIFPEGRWQFIHAIDFSVQNGAGSTVVGVTTLNDAEIACALVTIEGFTLFEAVLREGEALEVRRAVPPFDKPAFAEGLMRDVRAIFRLPAGEITQYGWSVNKAPVCRYTGDDGRVTDILPTADGCWQINTFTPELLMDRAIVGRSCREREGWLIPEYLELKGFGQSDYTLKMTLINAENLNK